jgi:hypothetical protein
MRTLSSVVALAVLSAVAGCSMYSNEDGKSETPSPAPAGGGSSTPDPKTDPMSPAPKPAPGMAMIRVTHGASDAPRVDVYVKGGGKEPVISGLAYGETSKWLEVPAAEYQFEIKASPSTASSPVVYTTAPVTLPDGGHTTAVAAGLVGAKDPEAAFRVIPLHEKYDAASPGNARVRVLHAGADAPAVGLDVGADDPSKPEVDGVGRFTDTGPAGIELPANKWFQIGIAAGGSRVTSFTPPNLPEGGNILVIATGLLSKLPREKSGFALLAVGPSGSIGFIKQDPTIYALHAGPDAPTVDAFVGDARIVDNLSFGELSAPIQVTPGAYGIDFYGHTDGDARPASKPAASSSSGKLEAGERYLAIATGFLSNASAPFRLAGYREGFSTAGSGPRLRAIHASPDAPAVDIGLASGNALSPVLFKNLSFGNASSEDGLEANASALPVGIAAAGTTSGLVARFTVSAVDQQRAFVVAAGSLNHVGGRGLRFLVVDTTKTPWSVATVLPH